MRARQTTSQVSCRLVETEANVMRRAGDDDDGLLAQAAISRIHGDTSRAWFHELEHAGCGANRCTV